MNQKGFTNIALIILVVVLAGAAGYFALRKPATSPIEPTPTSQATLSTSQTPPAINNVVTPKTSPSNDSTANWKIYNDVVRGFSLKYPSSWTYQKFSCNLDGIAFCPIKNGLSGCGQTCGMDSPSSPIYLYPLYGKQTTPWPDSETYKYWADANISLKLGDAKYQDIYKKMADSYQFIGKKIYPKPTATLNFSPAVISKGESSTLSWSSTNADNCYASGAPDASFNWFGNQSTSGGTQIYNNIQNSLTFELSCENAEGTQDVTAKVTLLVQ